MEIRRQAELTAAELRDQELIGELVRGIGLDLAWDCPDLGGDDDRDEFSERARRAVQRLFMHMKRDDAYRPLILALFDFYDAAHPPTDGSAE